MHTYSAGSEFIIYLLDIYLIKNATETYTLKQTVPGFWPITATPHQQGFFFLSYIQYVIAHIS